MGLNRLLKCTASAAIAVAAATANSVNAGTITSITLTSNAGGSASLFSGSHDLSTMVPLNLSLGGLHTGFAGVNYKDINQFIINMTIGGGPFNPPFDVTGSVSGTYQGGIQIGPLFVPVFSGPISASGLGSSILSFNLPVVPDGISVMLGVVTPITELNAALNVTPVPIPAAAVLLGSGLLGMLGVGRLVRRRDTEDAIG